MQQNDSNNRLKPSGPETLYGTTRRNSPHLLSPLRPVTVITEAGPSDLSVDQVLPAHVGLKAYGLSSLPSEWVPPFFVIASSCFGWSCSNDTVDAWVAECLARVGISADRLVMVRSSGTSETMQNRGRLESKSCGTSDVATTIRNLIQRLPQALGGKVHWMVQECIDPKRKGHLSNERRLSRENRDWIAEFEPQIDHPGYTVSIAVRPWRDGIELTELNLRCTSEPEISLRLKRVAMWATRTTSRTHFEWVWDGHTIRVVQADVEDPATGVRPSSLLPAQIPAVEPAPLQVFRLADEKDFERYGKLRNAKLYTQLGYNMPIFYVIDDPDVMNRVLAGDIPTKVVLDLAELTKRPLILRTDGSSIPGDKRDMLPRSDELRSISEAKGWLLSDFKSQTERSALANCGLCIIGHHFIPSVASAWARAEPGKRMVRIESLWGIPEGLYWYSHDTFEVDTQTVEVDRGSVAAPLTYKRWERLRFKGTFVGADKDGKWIPYQTMPPYDWRSSIRERRWLFEIAHTTRQVAELENHGVSLMWFIDNHPQATAHKVLPWFHNKSELAGPPKAAPRRKRPSASDFNIKSVADWHRLREDVKSGKRIERIVVEPVDPELIRNLPFVRELAELAASRRFVVELSGGILSHAYYILQCRGAQVECADLFGADEEVVEYNKVVRDKVPVLIEKRGERVETVRLAGDALVTALRQKLVEETFEALDAKSGEELIGELADVEEVVRALCGALHLTPDQVESERQEKLQRRGGFVAGLMLTRTATPHSVQKQSTAPDPPSLELKVQQPPEPVISDETDLPARPLYRRPDLRQVEQQLEKLFTFATEINRIGDVKATLNFSMPLGHQREQAFTLTLELHRTHSSLRGIVRLRPRLSQLAIDFPSPQLSLKFPDQL